MRRSNKTMAVLAAATIAITAGFAVNNANAAPNNGSIPFEFGSLELCVGEGQGYVVADGPTFVQTPTLNNGCDTPHRVRAGTYYIKADKYIDGLCFTGKPRTRGGIDVTQRCHAKVHHAHTSRYELPGGQGLAALTAPFTRPAGSPFTTIEVPDYVIVNVVPGDRTFVSLHVVDEDYPDCLTPPAGRTCNSTIAGSSAGI